MRQLVIEHCLERGAVKDHNLRRRSNHRWRWAIARHLFLFANRISGSGIMEQYMDFVEDTFSDRVITNGHFTSCIPLLFIGIWAN